MLTLLCAELSHLGVCCIREQIIALVVLETNEAIRMDGALLPSSLNVAPTAAQQSFQLLDESDCRCFVTDELRAVGYVCEEYTVELG